MKTEIAEILVEWDENKNKINIQKHGISFETTASARRQIHLRGGSIMESEKIVKKAVNPGQEPTGAMIKEIEAASVRPVVSDDDAPELTLEQYAEMADIARKKRSKSVKPVIAIRISPETLEKAKATGKGYTGFLSRLLDNAINDPQMVAKSLL